MAKGIGSRITRAEFARRAGVNRSTITRWIESGRLTLGVDGLLDEAEAHRQRAASESQQPHHQARKAQLDLDKAHAGARGDDLAGRNPMQTAGGPVRMGATPADAARSASAGLAGDLLDPDGLDGLSTARHGLPLELDEVVRRTRHAQMLEREAVARMKAREDQEAAGQLLRRTAVERAMIDACAVIINAAETVPDRVAPLLVGVDDMARIRAVLRDEIEQFIGKASAELARVAESRP
jgi:hypothetical protein